jgi:hypothetical protein
LGNLAGRRTTPVRGAQGADDPRGESKVLSQLQSGQEQQDRPTSGDGSGFAPTHTRYPNVSNTNELQSLKNYVDEQREQMQNIIGGMQNDYRRLVRSFDKFSIANFPSHKVELGGNTRNTSATSCHDQSQPLYGMSMDTYPEQPQKGSKSANLHMPGPSAREREPSRPATVGPIFNELPRHAPEPQYMAHNLNYPVGPSAYNDGRSAYNEGRSGLMSGRSAERELGLHLFPKLILVVELPNTNIWTN